MLKKVKHAALAIMLAGGTLVSATTAEARDRWRDNDDDAALAIGAGIVGLAIGAAIASDNDDRYYYRDRRYYRSYPRHYYYDGYPRRYRDYRYRDRWDRRDDRRHYRYDRRRWRY